jgi:hypothetical protein
MHTKDFLPIPPIETATDPIGSPADLRQRWRAVMGELGFDERLLWVGFVGADRRLYKTMTQVPICSQATSRTIEFIMSRLPRVLASLDPGTTVALLLTRPGRGPISTDDRVWSVALTDAAELFGVPVEPIFRANDEALVLVEPV